MEELKNYNRDSLEKLTLKELKKHALEIGVIGVRAKHRRCSWINAILEQQARVFRSSKYAIPAVNWQIATDEEVKIAAAEAKKCLGV
jgi:hypothetical protein